MLEMFIIWGPDLSGWRVPVVEVLFIGAHPNLCGSYSILEEVGSRVWGLFRKHMANVRAGMDLQTASTLPNLWVPEIIQESNIWARSQPKKCSTEVLSCETINQQKKRHFLLFELTFIKLLS